MLEFKSVAAEYKADLTKREVVGYASVFGNVDGVGDVVLPGAYTKTLSEDLPAGRIKVKRNHQYLIGKPVHAEQDSKGLLTVSRISDTDIGNETLVLVQDGVIDRMSIGYYADEKGNAMRGGQKVRELKTIRLTEWSFLDDPPANDLAVVTGVKSLDDACRVMDQMQSVLWNLRSLASVPPEIVQRVVALVRDAQPIVAAADAADDIAENEEMYAAITETLAQLRTLIPA